MNIHVDVPKSLAHNIEFAWLEITGKCQLSCHHCYADSGPKKSHGRMSIQDWKDSIDQLKEHGCKLVQFIGGEPTLNPYFEELAEYVLRQDMAVEVFSNLVKVSPKQWNLYSNKKVRLATSYYADNPVVHDRITKLIGSYEKTKNNIEECVNRNIPIRAGIIIVDDDQNESLARKELEDLGVKEINVDYLRQVGRGENKSENQPANTKEAQLCGACGHNKIAISNDGSVWPCVFSRWLPVGNVLKENLETMFASDQMNKVSNILENEFSKREIVSGPCDPKCGPNCSPACNPSCWPTGSGPCGPNGGCQPNYG